MVESVGYESGNDERCHAIMVMVHERLFHSDDGSGGW